MTPVMASATVTRGLAMKRPARLILCLHRALPTRARPILASVARGVGSAAQTSAASVLAWLLRSAAQALRIQLRTSVRFMAVPPPRWSEKGCVVTPFYEQTDADGT